MFVVVLLLALVSLRSPIYAAISIASYLAVIVIHETGRCESEASYSESDHVMIAWGGVLAQLAVAIPILIVAQVSADPDFGYAGPLVGILGYVNVVIALANLAPAPGLDGHTAWRAIPLLWQWQLTRVRKPRRRAQPRRR